ncbi:MAG: hypothetical protein JJ877_09205 [Thalassococcus sp.]|uniref:hypothetical protein n=1 Tax=Thalassococcus sp. TaxID=1928858 RepID=UPI001B1C88E5|nr:hypothetical protein [Thalassococcus sp.]MBO6867209.1 hypothetical protein [Thalassococcus sp.]
MSTYAISYRLEYDTDYSDRRESVVNAIRKEAEDGKYWEELTSLTVLRSRNSANYIASMIYLGSSFKPEKDSLLVVNTSNGTFATKGKIEYPYTLESLFSHEAAQKSGFS